MGYVDLVRQRRGGIGCLHQQLILEEVAVWPGRQVRDGGDMVARTMGYLIDKSEMCYVYE